MLGYLLKRRETKYRSYTNNSTGINTWLTFVSMCFLSNIHTLTCTLESNLGFGVPTTVGRDWTTNFSISEWPVLPLEPQPCLCLCDHFCLRSSGRFILCTSDLLFHDLVHAAATFLILQLAQQRRPRPRFHPTPRRRPTSWSRGWMAANSGCRLMLRCPHAFSKCSVWW